MSLPYYKFFPAPIAGNYKLNKLTPTQYGIFAKLFFVQAWLHEGKLPDDDEYLANLANVPVQEWKILKECLLSSGIVKWIDECLIWNEMDGKWKGAANHSETMKKVRDVREKKKVEQIDKELSPTRQLVY